MNNPAIIRFGFDKLDLAYRCEPPPTLIAALQAAKAVAGLERRDQVVDFAGQRFLVAAHGGQGGYAYQIDTGEAGAIIWVKEPNPADPWAVRVSVRAIRLALEGLDAAKEAVDAFLIALGFSWQAVDCRVGRIDVAVDVLWPGFDPSKAEFRTHSRRGRKVFRDLQEYGVQGHCTGTTFGKMPGWQLCVYDKSTEARNSNKAHWFDLWRIAAESQNIFLPDKLEIWRFEMRAGKQALSGSLASTCWTVFKTQLSALLKGAWKKCELVVPTLDTNRSRWPRHALWDEIVRLPFAEEPATHISTEALLRHLEVENRSILLDQAVGSIVSYMAALFLGPNDVEIALSKLQRELALKAKNWPLGLAGKLESRKAERTVRFGDQIGEVRCHLNSPNSPDTLE